MILGSIPLKKHIVSIRSRKSNFRHSMCFRCHIYSTFCHTPRIHAKEFPAYAPELHPTESIGVKRIGHYPTPHPQFLRDCKPCFLIRLLRLSTHKNFSGLASMPLAFCGSEILLYPILVRSLIIYVKIRIKINT